MKNIYLNLSLLLALVALSVGISLFKPVNLGLDLKGGISMLLEPDMDYALTQEYERYAKDIERKLRDAGINVLDVTSDKSGIKVEVLDKKDIDSISQMVSKDFPRFEVVSREKGQVLIKLKDDEIKKLKDSIAGQTVEVLRRRIDELGVVQPVITKVSGDRVLVELPGVLDIDKAKSIIGKTALLELKLVVGSGPKEVLEQKLNKDTELLPSRNPQEWFLVEKLPVITGADLKTAYTSTDEFGAPAVTFELTDRGARAFGDATEKNIGRRLAIVLDKKVMSAPVIRSRITDRGQITGQFTPEEAKELAIVLRAGALPTNVKFLQETVVGPSLGRDAINQSIKAGIVGFILLVALLLGRYKVAGITANLAILLNALFLWAGLVLLGATLTLPGIAGILLNMGIAVDSNVLIFERVKEELRSGSSPKKAVELGYRRSLSVVWDTHITLLIAALILFQFGSGPVKGFATTLTIGSIASFVSNVYFTKFFLDVLTKIGALKI
ncbi:protein-export membrane protein SecD [Hydrogenobacter thermophilus TK-6]|uniref:Protein translocase subunit SecD n=1 Tax=Hydrogenobacter thermophilus (strain DSM 6534 / IAM 12695 / TK-6) TaxID=608538 RepID=D3DH34_HYDTT|nr:protein translocase subunit SecD [Hydrogenobacter thermophilus]ADO45072.1 protein-export membrane protein SecD [Hydrogenobacter thermophilus TK-6]BAI69136.1 protein-export membrane protein [Hydrogenobacter thermophilus TK-6]